VSSGRRSTLWLLVLPPAAWLLVFLVVPLVLMAAVSTRPDIRGGILSAWTPTLAQYQQAAAEPSYWRLLGTSVVLAAIVAAVASVLAWPLAYGLAFEAGRRAGVLLVLLLVPFWTSFLLRVMAWKLMLGSEGVINSFLGYVGLIDEPITALLYNRNAVAITLVYVWIPFAMLPILAALQRVDARLFDAAADLGSTPLSQIRDVALPLSMPGLLAAFFMVFIPTVGEYVTPLLVGGSAGSLYGNIIQLFFTQGTNYPFGSALSMVMLGLTIVLVVLGVRVIRPARFLAPAGREDAA
jgi:spermidine/putrescine transport system permease protein